MILFFWTKLRASLQQWQSLNCARIVIVRQRYQKERSGTEKRQKANKPPQHTNKHHNQSLTNRGEKVKQAQALTAIYNPRLSPRLQQEIVKVQCSVNNYAIAVPSSTCFRFFLRHFDTSCWLPTNCNDMTCSSSRTWAYMLASIPCSPGNSTGGAGWRSCHSWSCAVRQVLQA